MRSEDSIVLNKKLLICKCMFFFCYLEIKGFMHWNRKNVLFWELSFHLFVDNWRFTRYLYWQGCISVLVLYTRQDRFLHFFSLKNLYPKFLVARNCIKKKDIEIFFFVYLRKLPRFWGKFSITALCTNQY